MAKTQITWTILPNETMKDNPQTQQVSVVVSPRLKPDISSESKLGSGSFDEFLNWTEKIDSLKDNFSAVIGNNADSIPLELVNWDSEDAANLWSCLFKEDTPVNGFQYNDMSKVKLRSYSIRNILGYIKEYYEKLAVNSPSELPRLFPWNDAQHDLKEMLGKLFREKSKFPFSDQEPDFNRFFNEDFDENANGAFQSDIERDLYQADRFYRRVRPTEEERKKRRPDFKDIPKGPKVPEFDFHQIVAALADYPALMRRLGLILDFTLSRPIPIESGELRLHIDNRQNDPTVTDVTPKTAFFAGNGRFFTRSRNEDLKEGLLNLSKSDDSYTSDKKRFDIYQVDPDGAALKTVNFMIGLQNLIKENMLTGSNKHGATGDRQGLAALRSGGLGVSQRDRAQSIKDSASDYLNKFNDALERGSDGSDICLYAEDVFRGYRVDVADVRDEKEKGIWRSLCARKGEYRLVNADNENNPLEFEPEEGYVYGASTTSEEPDSDEHYLHESLFRWTGWSLCTPRPEKVLKAEEQSEDAGHIQTETPSEIGLDDVDNTVTKGCGVSATFTTPEGSLPRLRFGHLYRIRARVVDLAGNSLAVNDPLINDFFEGASEAVGYYRFEPIDPPVIVHRTRVSEGESLERMVIRSNYNISAEEYLNNTEPYSEIIEKAINEPDSQDFHYGKVNERHFVPPKSSQQQCETHGLFDKYFGTWEQIKEGYALAAGLESGTLYDGIDDNPEEVKIITPSALQDIATTKKDKPGLPSPKNPVGDRMTGGQYIIHGEAQLKTPWLPDGAAGGVAIRAAAGHKLPGMDNVQELGDYRLQLIGERTFAGVNNVQELGDSCCIQKINNEFVILVKNSGKWPNSGGFRLILAEAPDTELPDMHMENKTLPKWNEDDRTLTFFVSKGWIVRLVYASFVEKTYVESLGIPHWVSDVRQRAAVYNSALHGANWLITPYRELVLVHATQAPVLEPRFTDLILHRKPGSHDVILSDTNDKLTTRINLHVPSTGKFEVEAKWSEWVDDPTKPEPERVEFSGKLGEIRLAEEFPNEAPGFKLRNAVNEQLQDANDQNVQRADVHTLGDTRFRLIKYQIRATTRFREYLPPSIYEDQENVTRLGPVATDEYIKLPPEDDAGAPILYSSDEFSSNQQSIVPASAPPDDPRVLYVVPTMRWKSNKKSKDHDVTRYGNGLRVWLDRPWFSSGDGELLGVVIHNDSFKELHTDPELQPFVTQWGIDPFWTSDTPKSQIMEKDFPARKKSELLPLQENPSKQVVIVGHRVHWDGERRLWYCDIELDPLTTYMPFVRLALVRYQQHALNGAKISKVVLTDFAQVLPRRHVTVKIEGDKITAALRGPFPFLGPMLRETPIQMTHVALADFGQNSVELVLQTRDPQIDSDLSWRDTKIYKPEDYIISDGIKPHVVERLKDSIINMKTLAGSTVQLDSIVNLNELQQMLKTDLNIEFQKGKIEIEKLAFEEKPFWEATVKLPASDKTNAPRRLMIREFERFYKNAKTKEIGERLVFAEIINL